jgi:hypothetical protein
MGERASRIRLSISEAVLSWVARVGVSGVAAEIRGRMELALAFLADAEGFLDFFEAAFFVALDLEARLALLETLPVLGFFFLVRDFAAILSV